MQTQGNQEEDDGTPPVENSQNVTPETKERYKQILEGKEKQIDELNRARLVEKTARTVLNNQELLLDIDPELGKEVIKTLHLEGNATTDNYDEILENIKSLKKKPDNKSEVDVERLVDERLKKKEEEKAYAETDQIIKDWLKEAPEDKRDEMRVEFEELVDWRKLKPDKAKKIMEKIEAVYKKNELEEERKDGSFARMAASTLPKTQDPVKPPKWTLELARKLGYSERDMKEMKLI